MATDLVISASVEHILALAVPLEKLANERGIFHVFDDGGYRTLLMLTMFPTLKKPLGRLGDDATGPDGSTYELKTINLVNTKGEERTSYPGVTTEHTMRAENVARYRACTEWLIGVFRGNVPVQVWQLESRHLEPYYCAWEQKIAESRNGEVNNPKIPFGFVAAKGICHRVKGAEHIAIPKPGGPGKLFR